MSRRRKRQILPMICGKCGNDGITPGEVSNHGAKRCTSNKNRPDYCPLCHEDFFVVKEVQMTVTNFAKPNEDGSPNRSRKDVMRRSKWPAKKIYKHLEGHRRMGDTPEMFA